MANHNVDVQMVESGKGGPLLKIGQVTIPRLTPDAGNYVALDVKDYEMLPDYIVPSERYLVKSFSDILNNPPLREELKGKIILVATNLSSVKGTTIRVPWQRSIAGCSTCDVY